jgi:hypothetical protein
MSTPSQAISLQITIPPAHVHGTYVNGVAFAHQANEFVADFYDVPPGAPGGEVLARIRLSPILARRMLDALAHNIETYEKAFGPIVRGETPSQVVFDSTAS